MRIALLILFLSLVIAALPHPYNVIMGAVLAIITTLVAYGLWVVIRASDILHMDLVRFFSLETDKERCDMVAKHYRQQVALWLHRIDQRDVVPHTLIVTDDIDASIASIDPISQKEYAELMSIRKHLVRIGYL